MKRHEVKLVENSLEKTARLFSRNYKIKVRFDPKGSAQTDGKVITVPAIPPDASQDILDAMNGYVCHEASHILFSDWDVFRNHSGKEDKLLYYTMMFIEDIRIEREMIKEFPGSEYNFRVMVSVVFNKLHQTWDKIPIFHKVMSCTYLDMRHPGSNFMKTVEPEVTAYVSQVEDIINQHPLDSTADAIEIARKILEELKPEQQPSEDEPDVTVSGMIFGMVKKTDQESDNESLDAAIHSQSPMDSAGLIVKQIVGDTFDHSLKDRAVYLPYDTSQDIIQLAENKGDFSEVERLRRDASEQIGMLKQTLLNVLRSTLRARWTSGRLEGRLDRRQLYKVPMGVQNVFMARTEKPQLDTAIAIAIDQSGSMGYYEYEHSKLRLAAESAVVLGDVLNVLKVPFMIYGHSTEDSSFAYEEREGYSRWNKLWIQVYSRFGDNWNQSAHRLIHLPTKNNTLDGESLRWGAQQLLMRPEKRKVLFWFNDGWPQPGSGNEYHCKQYVHDVVAACAASGIEIVAFGIQSDAVKHYYKDHIVINSLDDLIKEPLQKLETILRRA